MATQWNWVSFVEQGPLAPDNQGLHEASTAAEDTQGFHEASTAATDTQGYTLATEDVEVVEVVEASGELDLTDELKKEPRGVRRSARLQQRSSVFHFQKKRRTHPSQDEGSGMGCCVVVEVFLSLESSEKPSFCLLEHPPLVWSRAPPGWFR